MAFYVGSSSCGIRNMRTVQSHVSVLSSKVVINCDISAPKSAPLVCTDGTGFENSGVPIYQKARSVPSQAMFSPQQISGPKLYRFVKQVGHNPHTSRITSLHQNIIVFHILHSCLQTLRKRAEDLPACLSKPTHTHPSLHHSLTIPPITTSLPAIREKTRCT